MFRAGDETVNNNGIPSPERRSGGTIQPKMVSRLRHCVPEHQNNWDMYGIPLAYASNMQVLRSTKLTPFSLVLSTPPPGQATPTTRGLLPGVEEVASPWAHRIKSIRRAAELLHRANRNLRETQSRYKRDHDKKVRFKTRYASGDHVSVDRRWLKTTDAKRMAFEHYTNLLPGRHDPYMIISSGPETIIIWQHGIENRVSTNRVTNAPSQNRNDKEINSSPRRQMPINERLKTKGVSKALVTAEYTIDRLVRHIETNMGTQYISR